MKEESSEYPTQNQTKPGKNWLALIIPFFSGSLFFVIFTSFLYFWSQSIDESRRLTTDIFNPFQEISVTLFLFLIGFLPGVLPTISIFLRARKVVSISLTLVSILILIILFCVFSWFSMWMINP